MIPYVPQPSLQVGPVTVHAFGVIVAAAFALGLELGRRRVRRLGLDAAVGEGMAWWAVVAGFIGAHLFSVLAYFPHEVRANPLLLFKFWEDVSSFGGILGGLLGIGLFLRLKAPARLGRPLTGRESWAYLDVAAFVFPFALALGRVACTLAHDHPGTLTTFPLAVSLEQPAAQAYIREVFAAVGRLAELPPPVALARLGFHDLGWYEFLYLALVVIPAFLFLDRRRRAPGFFLGAFVALYMPVRFALDVLRISDARYLGLTPAQWTSVVLLIATPVVLRYRRPGASQASPEAPSRAGS